MANFDCGKCVRQNVIFQQRDQVSDQRRIEQVWPHFVASNHSFSEGPNARRFRTNTNILFLDACRDNPLARNLARSMGTRSSEVGSGLARIESGVGTLISFSTQPGNVALDGTGRNSPFAGALVKQLDTSTDDLGAMLIAVRNEVMQTTQRKQVPWENSALTGRLYFKTAAQTATLPKAEPARLSEAAEAWDRVQDASSVAMLESYATRYKDTIYAEWARGRIEELKKQQVAVAKSEPEPKGNQSKPVEQKTAMVETAKPLLQKESSISIAGTWSWQSKCNSGFE